MGYGINSIQIYIIFYINKFIISLKINNFKIKELQKQIKCKKYM